MGDFACRIAQAVYFEFSNEYSACLLAVAGFFTAALAVSLAYVRRAGRREEATRALVAATNPDGLKAHWARKATNKLK